jgi:hypothetical protein
MVGGIAYATPIVALAPTWRCARCKRSWGARDISPAVNVDLLRCLPPEDQAHAAAASLDARLLDEPLLCDAVYNYTGQVLRGGRPLGYSEAASLVHATSRLLGERHWATAQSYSMRCSVLGPLLSSSAAASAALSSFGLTPADARTEYLEGAELCWRFCAQSMQPPSVCGDAFIGSGAVALLVQHAVVRRRAALSAGAGAASSITVSSDALAMTEVRLRALACLSGLVSSSYCGAAAARAALKLDGGASAAEPAAAALRGRADAALSAGEAKEALVYYRAALMCDPTEVSIHASLAACTIQCGEP